jgi:hypothetical protein
MYQPMLPLKTSSSAFRPSPIINILESAKQDFKHLLLCTPGEWPGRPRVGVGLARHLFEPETSEYWQELEKRIYDQVKLYLPEFTIFGVKINMGEQAGSVRVSNDGPGQTPVISTDIGTDEPITQVIINYKVNWLGFGTLGIGAYMPSRQILFEDYPASLLTAQNESSYLGPNRVWRSTDGTGS